MWRRLVALQRRIESCVIRMESKRQRWLNSGDTTHGLAKRRVLFRYAS